MKNLLLILLIILPSALLGQSNVKKFFKYSTFYTSFNQSNAMVQEAVDEIIMSSF